MDGQLSFATLDYAGKKKRTKRDVFLAEMAAAVPWSVLEAVTAASLRTGPRCSRCWHSQTCISPAGHLRPPDEIRPSAPARRCELPALTRKKRSPKPQTIASPR